MNHDKLANINHIIAIIIVFFHFDLSCSIDQKSIWYAQTITKITAIVQAIHIAKSIAHFMTLGISST